MEKGWKIFDEKKCEALSFAWVDIAEVGDDQERARSVAWPAGRSLARSLSPREMSHP